MCSQACSPLAYLMQFSKYCICIRGGGKPSAAHVMSPSTATRNLGRWTSLHHGHVTKPSLQHWTRQLLHRTCWQGRNRGFMSPSKAKASQQIPHRSQPLSSAVLCSTSAWCLQAQGRALVRSKCCMSWRGVLLWHMSDNTIVQDPVCDQVCR